MENANLNLLLYWTEQNSWHNHDMTLLVNTYAWILRDYLQAISSPQNYGRTFYTRNQLCQYDVERSTDNTPNLIHDQHGINHGSEH